MTDSFLEEMLSEARENFISGNYKVSEPLLNQLILQNTLKGDADLEEVVEAILERISMKDVI